MITAAIYTRKSRYTGKGESIENQINACKEYLKRQDIDDFIIYEDEGFSGKNSDRPKFKQMMKDAKAKRFSVLICYRLDRVSRNVADFSSLIQELEKYNISFISVSEQFDTSTPMGRAMMYISSVFAQLERETIAERIKDNMLELAKSGRWLGGQTPTGYESKRITYIDGEFKERSLYELSPLAEELDLVRLIFDKYLELKSLSQVHKFLLSHNLKTKLNTDWDRGKIRSILVNPVYVKANDEVFEFLEESGVTVVGKPDGNSGILSYNKRSGKSGYREAPEWIYAVSRHKGIIEPDKWVKVQLTLEGNKEKAPRLGKTSTALLTGILRCAKCGSTMRVAYGKLNKTTGVKPYYYACKMKHESGGTRCINKNVNGRKLENAVIEKLKDLTYNEGKLIHEMENYRKEILTNSVLKSRIDNIVSSMNENKLAIENLMATLSMTQDKETSKLLVGKLEELTSQKQNLEHDLKEYQDYKNTLESQVKNCDLILESLKNFSSLIDTCNIEEKRLLLSSVIETLYWDGLTSDIVMHFWGAGKKK